MIRKRYSCSSCGASLRPDGSCPQAMYHAPGRRAREVAKRERDARRAREDRAHLLTPRDMARVAANMSLAEAAKYEAHRERARTGWRNRGQGRDLGGPTAPAAPNAREEA